MVLTKVKTQTYPTKELLGYKFIEEGEGEPIILLHGLFGSLSNWNNVIDYFSTKYKVIVPILPVYDAKITEANLESLLTYIEIFFYIKQLQKVILTGNSLGGHLALLYTLKHPDKVDKLILAGSSGLFENMIGSTFPKRGDYEFIKEKVSYTFYKKEVVTKELVDEVYEVTQSIPKALKIISLARSAQKNNLADKLHQIIVPTLLIWGINDVITPTTTAIQFKKLIPNSVIRYIDECGHVPMMEQPHHFNKYMDDFIKTSFWIS